MVTIMLTGKLGRGVSPYPYHAFKEGQLFGDFEYLINTYLGSSKEIKLAVSEADRTGKGFNTLLYYLRKQGRAGYKDDHVFKICSEDGFPCHLEYRADFYAEVEELPLPSGVSFEKAKSRYVVDMIVEDKRVRKRFKQREEAVTHRQQLLQVVRSQKG